MSIWLSILGLIGILSLSVLGIFAWQINDLLKEMPY